MLVVRNGCGLDPQPEAQYRAPVGGLTAAPGTLAHLWTERSGEKESCCCRGGFTNHTRFSPGRPPSTTATTSAQPSGQPSIRRQLRRRLQHPLASERQLHDRVGCDGCSRGRHATADSTTTATASPANQRKRTRAIQTADVYGSANLRRAEL
jgi:hypothetical protein